MKENIESKKKKVLIVEDDQWILRILTHLLQQWNFEVLSTKDPAEALDVALKNNPDIVLLDLVFTTNPDITGNLILSLLKSTEYLKDIPVIIVSGNLNKQNITSLIKSGASAFIAKPFTEKTLFEKLTEILGDFVNMEEYLKTKASQIDYRVYG